MTDALQTSGMSSWEVSTRDPRTASTTAATSEKPAERLWYAGVSGSTVGPLTIRELVDLWERGEISLESEVWREGDPQWRVIADVYELSFLVAQHPQRRGLNRNIEWRHPMAESLHDLVKTELHSLEPRRPSPPPPPPAAPMSGLNLPPIQPMRDPWAFTLGQVPPFTPVVLVSPPPKTGSDTWMRVAVTVLTVLAVLSLGAAGWLAAQGLPRLSQVAHAEAGLSTPALAQPSSEPKSTGEAAPAQDPPLASIPTPPPSVSRPITERSTERGPKAEVKRASFLRELETKDIVAGVKANQESIKSCLVRANASRRIMPGTYGLNLSWTIRPDGSVIAPRVKAPPELAATEAPRCVAAAMGKWRFKRSKSGAPVTNFPFGPFTIR